MESAHLDLATVVQHLLIERCQLLRQIGCLSSSFVQRHAAIAQRLDQRRPISAGKFGQPLIEPLAHLGGRALGEGDGQNLVRRHALEQRAHHA